MEKTDKKLTFKHYIIIGSMLFGMFFGAGNLIFPIHLGQLAGGHWLTAGLGFLLTGTLLPLLGIIAISITRSTGIYDLAKPIGHRYASFFMILTCATLGPLFATPRTATTPFQISIATHISASQEPWYLLGYSLIFFLLAGFFSRKPTGIVDAIGKILNPAFLILLAIIFGIAFTNPMGSASSAHITSDYQNGALLNGFLQGYNTMDALAALLFGIVVVTSIRSFGQNKPSSIAKTAAKSSLLSIALEAFIYLVLIWIGATSLTHFKISADGGIAFSQIANHFMGLPGEIILAVMATLTCLTTAVGLLTSFAEALHEKFPKISYKSWDMISCIASFLIANIGLEQIIAWSTPMLMFLYPLAITLIILSIASPLFNRDPIVYRLTTIFTIIPALIDALNSVPAIISEQGFAQQILKWDQMYLPFAKYGMDWLLPALIGLLAGLIIHYVQPSIKRSKLKTE
ncbi:branched-chain amino acid transport system II carrier protein [Companilactobacillus allii]|uniref:Branched-chain amino acid transport system carrier protein n=1 Tax=Companilactobacillus allii TaxID=1847728 RepID=A0A1P8Q356_9LACO|nr:branched-chain amino acid transport system II carrier protein [Companilactobacillus allii]APX72266.1 branched-chain amino acid transport system II carrier protein [Companilactobacillus allii]USQ69360.1 branched-chain amino acid transport system II carrier protein [Companilactobacillus allii]